MNNFLDFLTTSSTNPEKYSATVKGILITYAGTIVAVLSIFNFGVTYDVVIEYISKGSMILGLLLSMFGLCRKIYFLFKTPSDTI